MPSAWACLAIFLTVVSHILFHLMCHWSLKFKVAATYEPAESLDADCFLLVMPHNQKGFPELGRICEPSVANNCTFEFQHIRYLY